MEEEDEKTTHAFFDYSYLEVKDLDYLNETLTKINVWQLNDPDRKEFLMHNLRTEHYENLMFAIVLDFTKPWEFLDQLSKWSDVMFEINKKFFLQLPVSKQNQLRKKIEDHFKFYKNPDKKEDEFVQTEENAKEPSTSEEEMRQAINDMPLDEGILNVNLGIPIMIICNKSEVVATAETTKYYQQRLEFIMKHLREFALRYGASIMFTSTKKGTNMLGLYSYLLHRFFDSNPVSPELTNKESMFIPTGYDSPKLVQQLCPSIDDPYDKIVIKIKASRDVAEQEEIK